MNDDDLVLGREYIIKQGPHQTVCQINHVGYRHNVNTFEKEDASKLRLNEIGKVEIRTIEPLVISDYDKPSPWGFCHHRSNDQPSPLGPGWLELTPVHRITGNSPQGYPSRTHHPGI